MKPPVKRLLGMLPTTALSLTVGLANPIAADAAGFGGRGFHGGGFGGFGGHGGGFGGFGGRGFGGFRGGYGGRSFGARAYGGAARGNFARIPSRAGVAGAAIRNGNFTNGVTRASGFYNSGWRTGYAGWGGYPGWGWGYGAGAGLALGVGLFGGALWYSALASGYPFYPYPLAPFYGVGYPFYAYGDPYYGYGYPFYAYYGYPSYSYWYPLRVFNYAYYWEPDYAYYWEPDYVYSYRYPAHRAAPRTYTCAICICPTVSSAAYVSASYASPAVALW